MTTMCKRLGSWWRGWRRLSFARILRQGGSWLLLLSLLGTARAASPPLPAPQRLSAGWELQDAAKVSDPAETLSRPDYHPAGWHPATVPGTVLTSLVNDKVYPEPLYGENNRPDRIPDSLCRAQYWYRTTFTPPQSYAGKRIWLTFHGINYMAEVWVNGHAVGTIKGAFARGIFDVTTHVTIGGANALAVRILPQPHPGETHEKTIATGTGLNGGVSAQDGPTFLCTIGWDWIPTIRDRDMGIWQEVVLSATGPVVVQDPYVTSELPLPRTDSADLTVRATLRNATDQAQAGVLTGTIDGATFKQQVALAPKETRTVSFSPAAFPALHLKKPRLWWPNGFGPQNLYQLRLSLAVDGAVSDTRDLSFGVRQITYSVPGSDNLALCVNGVPVFAKGGNWGMDEAMKRLPRRRLEAQIRMHQLANYTLIRNWVGQSTSEAFYDLCDQYGLLLWDEFFQPNPGDGPNPDNVELYLSNVREKILRFRSHPSVALWCARNEGDPPPVIGQGIQKLIDELDPKRLYQPSSTSGRGVISHGPYRWRTPREFYSTNEVFKTEIGTMSVPTLEAIQAMMPAKDWEVINDDWAEHDFCAGAQAGDCYPFIVANRYGPIASLADFTRKAQLANYEAYRAMYEGRQARMFRPATAVITWMSNPAQPSFVWQLYSHDLEPNASLYGTRKACEPIHIQMNQNDWRLMVVNHTPQALQGAQAKATVLGLDGRVQATQNVPAAAAPSAATDLGAVAFPAQPAGVHFVKLELRDARNRLLSENFYWRGAPEREDDFQALNALPMVALDIQAKRHDAAGQCLLEVAVRNPTQSVALMTHLQLRQAGSGRRVLPVYYSDNYLSLLPGESKRLTIEAAVADLGGEAPLLAVDGWNVTVQPVPASGRTVAVVPNTAATVRTGAAPVPAEEMPALLNLNCSGKPVGMFRFGAANHDVFAQDYWHYVKSGKSISNNAAIDTSVAKAAPAPVYQTARAGQFTYTLPVGKWPACTVRLHFAEAQFDPGQRQFHVDLNGRRVLTDYDIAAEAGRNKAVVKEFPGIVPDQNGNITLMLSRGAAGDPILCGVQVLR